MERLILKQAIKFLPHLKIRDKAGNSVPLNPNPCQQMLLKKMLELEEKGRPLWVILLKSRQIGGSTLMEGLLTAHCIAEYNARALLAAHQATSSKELFERALMMWQSCPIGKRRPDPTQRMLVFPHKDGHSNFRHATAGSISGGRGMTLSALHLSEAAFFPGDSFTALLPTVPYVKGSILCIESTANGKEGGPGEAFYRIWCDAVEGRSEFTPIFIPWTVDPECVRDPVEAKDAPCDDEEKELLKCGVNRAQLAWRRWALNSRCQGYIEKLHAEYPHTWEEAFVASGDPAFTSEEIRFADSTIRKPIFEGRIDLTASGFSLQKLGRGGDAALRIWAWPVDGHNYYLGADAARGVEVGDFSAAVVWDGHTGEQVATFADKISAKPFASVIDKLGRYYNNAMANIELTGGYGTHVQAVLRDDLRYNNFYIWRGKNDKLQRRLGVALGWETTFFSRERMFTAFREALRAKELIIYDERMVVQMKSAIRQDGRIDILCDHDDILFGGLIGWIARVDYPPAGSMKMVKEEGNKKIERWGRPVEEIPDLFPDHRRMINNILAGRRTNNDPLAGI